MRACRGIMTLLGTMFQLESTCCELDVVNLEYQDTSAHPPYLSTVISGNAAPRGSILS